MILSKLGSPLIVGYFRPKVTLTRLLRYGATSDSSHLSLMGDVLILAGAW